jgi:hypothetical protein
VRTARTEYLDRIPILDRRHLNTILHECGGHFKGATRVSPLCFVATVIGWHTAVDPGRASPICGSSWVTLRTCG